MTPRAYHISAHVDPAFRRTVSGALLRRWAAALLAALELPAGATLDLLVCDDEHVRALNRDYRALDEATDVLSFPFTNRAAPGLYYGESPAAPAPPGDFLLPPRTGEALGEIVISFPYAQRQAGLQGHSPRAEVRLLLVHGILHLLGYDHMTPEEDSAMQARTGVLLSLLDVSVQGGT